MTGFLVVLVVGSLKVTMKVAMKFYIAISRQQKPLQSRSNGMFIEMHRKTIQPCKGGIFIITVLKTEHLFDLGTGAV